MPPAPRSFKEIAGKADLRSTGKFAGNALLIHFRKSLLEENGARYSLGKEFLEGVATNLQLVLIRLRQILPPQGLCAYFHFRMLSKRHLVRKKFKRLMF
jgi:hypothetical protein